MASVHMRMLIVGQTQTCKCTRPTGVLHSSQCYQTPPVYAVMDKSKKMRAQWKEDNGYTVAFIHQCTMPMMGTMSNIKKGVVASGGKEEGEQYNDTVYRD